MKTPPICKNGIVIDGDREIAVGSRQWDFWLDSASSFRYEAPSGETMTVRQQSGKWYAFKKRAGKSYSAYIGLLDEKPIEKLDAALKTLEDKYLNDPKKGETTKVDDSHIDQLQAQINELNQRLAALEGKHARTLIEPQRALLPA